MSDDEWVWELSANAQDDLDALSLGEQDRILEKLDEITTHHGVSHLTTANHSKTVHIERSVWASFGSQ